LSPSKTTNNQGGNKVTDLPQVKLPAVITVKQLAIELDIEPVRVIKQLMRHGIMANVNQIIDYDTAAEITSEFGYTAKHKITSRVASPHEIQKKKNLSTRPPVVTAMGHVDHGKTTLLDAIRKTHVTAHEAGEITQHIGAYQATINGRKITFLDTPGHEAFTAMRAHGANVTDIVVLVIAADDGIMPQTIEAINHAKAAGVPIVVAINKIDKPNANVDMVKKGLNSLGLTIEEWGGDIICVPLSAKEEQGISDLLENLFLVADILELKANPKQPATGVVIEAQLSKNKGPLATLLVQNGTLEKGNVVVAGNTWGKIKAMFNDHGDQIKKAGPSTPVEVLGMNGIPTAGNTFSIVSSEHIARDMMESRATSTTAPMSLTSLSSQISKEQVKEITVILKTDVQGSIEPIKTSIEKSSTEKTRVNIIHAASGNITESDVLLASASGGIIIGFNARPTPGAQQMADKEGVSIHHYDIIYKLVEDIEKTLKGILEPTYIEVIIGQAEVRAVYTSGKKNKVAGIYVKEGKMLRDAQARVLHQGKVIYQSKVSSLKRFKEDVKEVSTGFECGIGIEGLNDFQVGDIIEIYKQEKAT